MLNVRALWTTVRLATVVALIAPAVSSHAEPVPSQQSEQNPFAVPDSLQSQVTFWKRIFGTYSVYQVVIHDALHLDRVYKVLDFQPLVAAGLSDAEIDVIRHRTVESELTRLRATLARLQTLSSDPRAITNLSADDRKIWALFQHVKKPRRSLAAAPDRLRTQSGLKERFARGLEVATRYWPEIERIFREEGVPRELTRLPLVESCFNVRAYSKAGAAGVWQFMPTTGRRFMRIDDAVDERRDPIISARAAARYLRSDYEALGTWPLAVTAYNHGRAGMARAVSTVGTTDIAEIVRHYQGPAFKFASRNFYAEFLAALEVEHEASRCFGDLRYEKPVPTRTIRLPHYVELKVLADCAGTSVETLADLNPAFTPEVIDGKLRVPRGYALRLPANHAKRFEDRYAKLPSRYRARTQLKMYVVHRVKRGQTLLAIARKYGTTVAAIRKRNNLKRSNFIRAGQELEIPRG
jgi:peptidoglycan lytic transglycosylase D